MAMTFSLMHQDKLKVSLNSDDLTQLGLTYQGMDYSDDKTRQALISLLERGRREAGFNPRGAKLYIEVFPSEDGGCVICYTRLQGGEIFPAGKFAPGPAPKIFAFTDPDVLIEACAGACAGYSHRILASSLYLLGRDYRLVVYPLDYSDNLSVSFLSEYGAMVGEGSILAAYCEEHGKLLVGTNAIETLSELY